MKAEKVSIDLGPGHNLTLVTISPSGITIAGEGDTLSIIRDGQDYWLVITLMDGSVINVRISDARLAERLFKMLDELKQ